MRAPECTQSPAVPILDTVFATAFAALTVASVAGLVAQEDCDHEEGLCLDFTALFATFAVGSGIGTGLHTASAVYGYQETASCRKLDEDWYRVQFEAQSRQFPAK